MSSIPIPRPSASYVLPTKTRRRWPFEAHSNSECLRLIFGEIAVVSIEINLDRSIKGEYTGNHGLDNRFTCGFAKSESNALACVAWVIGMVLKSNALWRWRRRWLWRSRRRRRRR